MNVSLPDGTKEEKAEYLLNQLINPPAGKASPLCDGTKINYIKIEDEIATVDFSKEYYITLEILYLYWFNYSSS